jgi:hypothetical protein
MTSLTIPHVIEASLGIAVEPSSLRFVRPSRVGVTSGDVS